MCLVVILVAIRPMGQKRDREAGGRQTSNLTDARQPCRVMAWKRGAGRGGMGCPPNADHNPVSGVL